MEAGTVTPTQQLIRAVREGAAEVVRKLLAEYSELRSDKQWLNRTLVYAKDNVAVIEALVEAGADINAGKDSKMPEGAVYESVKNRAMNAVRWMLAHGAKLNHEVDGERRCFALTTAVVNGDVEMVKLLVEHGADYNAVWRKDSNALSYAMMYGQREIEQYLRSIGAKEPRELMGGAQEKQSRSAVKSPTLMDHIREQLGEPHPLSIQQVGSSEPAISIHMVPRPNGTTALVTTGMSDRPMQVPPGEELFRYGELVMFLPAGWPRWPDARKRSDDAWPYEWMLRVAAYPHDHDTWFGSATVVDCGGPLAPNTLMSCLLAVTENSSLGRVRLVDGRTIVLYFVTPIYQEERDVELREGTERLLDLLKRNGIGKIVDVNRRNVATQPGGGQ